MVLLICRGAAPTLGVVTSAAGAASPTGKELHVLSHDTKATALLAGLLVIPLVKLQPSLDKDRTAFPKILARELGLTAPKGHVNISDFLDPLAVVPGSNPVHSHARVGHRSSLGSIADFRITGEIPEKHDFIDTGHGEIGVKT